jgi:uncharacterized protein with PIN domain
MELFLVLDVFLHNQKSNNEARSAYMRRMLEPPPSSRCDHCGGVLTFKCVEPAHSVFGVTRNVYVCVACRREHVFASRLDQRTQSFATAGSSAER